METHQQDSLCLDFGKTPACGRHPGGTFYHVAAAVARCPRFDDHAPHQASVSVKPARGALDGGGGGLLGGDSGAQAPQGCSGISHAQGPPVKWASWPRRELS